MGKNKAIIRGMRFIPKVDKALMHLSCGVGGVDLKPSILGLIFFRHVSGKLQSKPWDNLIQQLDDPELIARTYKGFQYIGEQVPDAGRMFEEIDLNNEKLGDKETRTKRLRDAIKAINEIQYEDDYSLANVYQYLLSLFASNPGRQGGEYYTPQSLCKLVAKLSLLHNPNPKLVYDPTCGSGSLLLTLYKEANTEPEVYGQEINRTTCNVSYGNMFLNGVKKHSIQLGDTLQDPKHKHLKFDSIVSNPPFSSRWDVVNDERFKQWPPIPATRADIAFWVHCIHQLAEGGVAVIVTAPGVLHRNQESLLRRQLIERNHVDTVIRLAPDLFLNTSIQVDVVILKKNRQESSVLFVDGSEYFRKERKFCVLTEEHLEAILNLCSQRATIQGKSYLATFEEIEQEGFCLSVSRYVEPNEKSFTPTDKHFGANLHTRIKESSKETITRLLLEEFLAHHIDEGCYGGRLEVLAHTKKMCSAIDWYFCKEKNFVSPLNHAKRYLSEIEELDGKKKKATK